MNDSTYPATTAVMVRPRVYIGESIALGPGKIDLLRAIGKTRSLSAAARSLGIPYKRAWLLVDSLNHGFGQPVVQAVAGGKGGGGTILTVLGAELVSRYDALERRINEASVAELKALRQLAI
ncbi:LysR family transcriptional regulator [Pigmentiphaga sp.]|uniref:winged helix-turn-helix domain-containing protein n=1 Tax=Pigmentiphaga sp. TaxID=1977564 RepID=UPI0025E3BA10|nr:LysR family transcriptional regulator [Pigmentiphaga sp.]